MRKTAFKRLIGLLCLLMMLIPQAFALDPVPACVPAPYDYSYQDEYRFIAIKRYQENGVSYFVCDIQVSQPEVLRAVLSGDKPYGREEKVADLAARSGAVLAINGDYYGAHKYGTIIRNAQLIRSTTTTRNMLIVDKNGDMSVRVDRSQDKAPKLGDDLMAIGTWQAFEFGPELVRDGQAVSFSPKFDVISTRDTRREPRTAMGQIGPLHYIVVMAEGRTSTSKGMTLPELQKVFVEHGAVTAMNLDGGGSAELWFNGQTISQHGSGIRSVSDIIIF